MRRSALVAWMLAAPLLAGCTGDGGVEEPPQGEEVPVVTDPRDYSYLQNATPGAHVHDYWQGRERVPVLAAEQGPMTASCTGCEEGMRVSWFQPEDGVIVPQGTRWVNGTLTTQFEEARYSRLELWVRTAEDPALRKRAEIGPDGRFSIESTKAQNDPPHYVLSLWEFEFRAFNEGEVKVKGKTGIQAEAVRGLPLEPYPPHPDFWDGATELRLLQQTQPLEMTRLNHPDGSTGTVCNPCTLTHRLGDGVLVPHDAREVAVRLDFGPGLPRGLGLAYHGADTRAFAAATAEADNPEAPLSTTFRLELAGSQADSPYAKQSLWEFEVVLDEPDQLPLHYWKGEYTITVTAHR